MREEMIRPETQVELTDTGLIELPTFDVKPYIGKEVKVAEVTEHQGQFGYYVKVETEAVTKFGDKDIRASKIFGLQQDVEGRVGWGKDTKLGVFLAKNKVAHYKDLVGKTVILQSRTNKEGTDFLDFN